jgi:hypothetical protein
MTDEGRSELLDRLDRWNAVLARHHAAPLITLDEADAMRVPALRRAVDATADHLADVLRAISRQ